MRLRGNGHSGQPILSYFLPKEYVIPCNALIEAQFDKEASSNEIKVNPGQAISVSSSPNGESEFKIVPGRSFYDPATWRLSFQPEMLFEPGSRVQVRIHNDAIWNSKGKLGLTNGCWEKLFQVRLEDPVDVYVGIFWSDSNVQPRKIRLMRNTRHMLDELISKICCAFSEILRPWEIKEMRSSSCRINTDEEVMHLHQFDLVVVNTSEAVFNRIYPRPSSPPPIGSAAPRIRGIIQSNLGNHPMESSASTMEEFSQHALEAVGLDTQVNVIVSVFDEEFQEFVALTDLAQLKTNTKHQFLLQMK